MSNIIIDLFLGKKSYLSIALTDPAGDLLLKTAELRDKDDNVIAIVGTLPLELIDSKQKLYITEPFDPPKESFKIVVSVSNWYSLSISDRQTL